MRKVLLTREYEDILKAAELFEAKGFEVLKLPLIRTQALPFEPPRGEFDFVVFQSKKAVKYFLDRANIPEGAKIVAVGGETKKALKNLGQDVLTPDEESARGLMELFKNIAPCKILLPRAKEGRTELLDFLRSNNFHVTDLKIYETVTVEYSRDELLKVLSQEPILVLASPSAVKSLFANLQKNMLLYQTNFRYVICIGETTKSAYQEYFKDFCYVPKKPSMEEVVNLALRLK